MIRTPETYYFSGGYVKFYRLGKTIYYQIHAYSEDGMTVGIIHSGQVKDQEHLKQLLAIQDLGSVSQ